MEDKIAKLEAATGEAQTEMNRLKDKFDEAIKNLDEAKDLLRNLDAETQKNVQITDTEIPELLESKAQAQDEYETAKTRYETNARYLRVFRGETSASAAEG
mmetsp:Transcript_30154/g.44672  ORF Transcript_30154/g.44672 Transcript_30154/m.44672 type:complete len:101 (-) Transcript_30154:210-512(-)|eukprot:CAMPEP_0195527640 /NCGR_PEP_ID=MMETSP0794_2-20130614/29485_1 /TAXON_ID=515487 /ORGANISM="Stephanopyxis turris, Strain CCMP 815" /LENGTH=100 /DNA_ID=CAMNT_0040658609 /DNA_START=52 /DNA_END=354 /DNA_ORIENTATION=-